MFRFLMMFMAAFGAAGAAGASDLDDDKSSLDAAPETNINDSDDSVAEPEEDDIVTSVTEPPEPEEDDIVTSVTEPLEPEEDDVVTSVTEPPEPEEDNDVVTEPATDTGSEPETEDTSTTPTTETEPEPADTPTAPTPTPEPAAEVDRDGITGRAALDIADGSLEASAITGRVTTLSFEGGDVSGVEILSKPAYGNVTVNPDNSLAVVLTGSTQTDALSFDIRVTRADNTVEDHTVSLDVVAGPLASGWGEGNFYMLETDENDDIMVEHGDVHRKVYVSGDEDALTLADIAALENLGSLSKGQWRAFLRDNEEYGSNPDMALAEDSANILWEELMQGSDEPSSHWLLFERGHTYDEVQLDWGKTQGESELHPVYFGAYGTGDRPVIATSYNSTTETGNIVFQGLHFDEGLRIRNKDDLLFDDVTSTNEMFGIMQSEGITLRNSDIYDVYKDAPRGDGDTWEPHFNRESGLYLQKSEGVLFEGNVFDHNGWADGYDPGLSADAPQPPSQYSHNMYLAVNNHDVTVRDSIIMQGAGNGLQLRSGGVIEDNVFIDNNGAFMFANGAGSGNYSLAIGNVVTSGAHKETDEGQGALTVGITNQTYMASLVDNIVTHLANPNDPTELDDKERGQHALKHVRDEPVYNDTIIYNWVGARAPGEFAQDQNIEGLDKTILDQTTIQNFAADLLGTSDATISDLSDYIRAQREGDFEDVVDAALIANFFRTGFGLETDLRDDATTARFVPDELGDGIRWDNRLNWATEDVPQDGDRVELAGNWVNYAGTTRLEDLDFGDDGKLSVSQGLLEVLDHISVGDEGAQLDIDRAGQFWTDGYTDQDLLDINVDGGRFANIGLFTGNADLTVADNGQAILATDGADYIMGEGSRLSILGDDAKVGFDGDSQDTAVLLMSENSTLSFTAEDGGIGQISEFRSGRFGEETSDVSSGANLGGAELQIDVTGLAAGSTHELMKVDEIIGEFGALSVTGLAGDQNAVLTIDYENDTVAIALGALGDGTGEVAMELLGNSANAETDSDLYAALTNGHGIYPDDLPDSIPTEEDNDPFVTF